MNCTLILLIKVTKETVWKPKKYNIQKCHHASDIPIHHIFQTDVARVGLWSTMTESDSWKMRGKAKQKVYAFIYTDATRDCDTVTRND